MHLKWQEYKPKILNTQIPEAFGKAKYLKPPWLLIWYHPIFCHLPLANVSIPWVATCFLSESFLQRLPKICPTAVEHDCTKFREGGWGGRQNYSLLSVIPKNQEFPRLNDQCLNWMRRTFTDFYTDSPVKGQAVFKKREL